MNDVDVAIAVADAGATVVRRRFGTTLQRLDKGAGDFATNADIEAENAMLALLHRERPEDAIFAEESGRSGATSSLRTWLIDPLCGTLNYAVQMRVAAVNVALRVGEKFIAAAVADPFNHKIFWTDRISAFSRAGGQDTPLAPDGGSKLVDLNFDPPFPNAPAFKAIMLAADSEFAASFRPRVVSSSVALTWVATGQRTAYITDGDVRDSVHFAAGLAICEAAGCTVTDLRGGVGGGGATGLVTAADAETHAVILSLVRKYLV
ncbi:MAG: inositol monophosphatase family protein [Candidatus Tectomicrobia bacterium]|nr:inositol monophosphatase family protein [Candidatus Tectomicrobia bacterium]